MNFWQRFRYYAFGLLIGTGFVMTVFGKRGCSWLPEYRVLRDLRTQAHGTVIDNTAACELQCLDISKQDVKMLMEQGDVDFSASKPRDSVKMYVISSITEKHEPFTLYIQSIDTSYARIIHATMPDKQCDCEEEVWKSKVLNFSFDSTVDSTIQDQVALYWEQATIDFEASDISEEPYAFTFVLPTAGKSITVKGILKEEGNFQIQEVK